MNKPPNHRKIIHIDMDAFYASVEQRDYPEYRNKALAVGWGGDRGVVMTASYEARKYGIHSAMPSSIAKRKCPELLFTLPRFDSYKVVSHQVRQIFKDYTNLVEPLSIDEAFLDVTLNKKDIPSATHVAEEIKQRILEETQLTATAGISFNKFLAKIASGMNKPNGLTVIHPKDAVAFVETLSVGKFHGVGKVTAKKMANLGIYTGLDLKQWSKKALIQHFGKVGGYFYRIARAIDNRLVEPNRVRKSVSAEDTFSEDVQDREMMLKQLKKITEIVVKRMKNTRSFGKTVTLKIKYHDFQVQTRSKTVYHLLQSYEQVFPIVEFLLHQPEFPTKAVRLLGVGISNLKEKGEDGLQLVMDL
ncbi:MAG: DNA polymerase IV [Chitinophagales bacterium]